MTGDEGRAIAWSLMFLAWECEEMFHDTIPTDELVFGGKTNCLEFDNAAVGDKLRLIVDAAQLMIDSPATFGGNSQLLDAAAWQLYVNLICLTSTNIAQLNEINSLVAYEDPEAYETQSIIWKAFCAVEPACLESPESIHPDLVGFNARSTNLKHWQALFSVFVSHAFVNYGAWEMPYEPDNPYTQRMVSEASADRFAYDLRRAYDLVKQSGLEPGDCPV